MKTIETLTVYLGSSGHARDIFQNSATALGALIGKAGKRLVYGGMDAGLMGRVAQAALENGAHVTGIIPRKLQDSERIKINLNETILVEDLWDRKKRMFSMADAIVTLPGGYGTADEALEVLYWGKLGLHNKPLVLVNIEGYWDDMIAYLRTLPDFDPRFLIVVDRIEDVMDALHDYTPVLIFDEEPDHYPHFEDEITRDTKEPIVVDVATVENSYYAVCALGLKQLNKHQRPIGFLNRGGEFDDFLKWISRAADEKFITQKCLELFSAAGNTQDLRDAMAAQGEVIIDLHDKKWGKPSD